MRVVISGLVVALVVGGSAVAAQASLLSGESAAGLPPPVPSPRQAALEAVLASFAVPPDCAGARDAYNLALRLDKGLKAAFTSMGDAKAALSITDWANAELAAAHLTEAVGAGTLAVAAVGTFASTATVTVLGTSIEASTFVTAISTVETSVNVLINTLFNGNSSSLDTALNGLSAATAGLTTALGSWERLEKLNPFGAPAVSAMATIASAAGSAISAVENLIQYGLDFKHQIDDANSAEKAYATAAAEYQAALARLNTEVSLMKTLAANCPAKTSSPGDHVVGGYFIYLNNGDVNNACSWTIGIAFGNVPGANYYNIQYYDGYYHQEISAGLAANQLAQGNVQLAKAKTIMGKKMTKPPPTGWHFYSITGGVSGTFANEIVKCSTDSGSPTENGRFGKNLKITAVVPSKSR